MGEGKMVEVKERLYDFNADGIAVLAKKPGDLVDTEELKRLQKTTKAFRAGKEPFAALQAAAAGQVNRNQEARDNGKVTTPLVDADKAKADTGAAAKAEAEKAAAAAPAAAPDPDKQPIDDMTVADLKAEAEARGVDISKCTKRAEILAALHAAE